MHPGGRGKIGSGILIWDSGGLLSELGFVGFVGWAGLRLGCELIPGFAVGAGLEDGLIGRVGVVQAQGGGEVMGPARWWVAL